MMKRGEKHTNKQIAGPATEQTAEQVTELDLRRIKRAGLLEMLVAQGKENEALQSQVEELNEKLQARELVMNQAGSIAEASLRLNGVFEAAQAAAQQYLDSIIEQSQKQEIICARMEAESRKKAEELLAETEQRCAALEQETQHKCADMLATAEREAAAYWDSLSSRLEQFYDAHQGLQDLLPDDLKRKLPV